MSELAVLVDLDKTTFRTHDFMADLAALLKARFGIEEYANLANNAHISGEGKLRYYDFHTHIEELGLDATEVEEVVIETFAGRDYSYEDVEAFIDFLLTRSGLAVHSLLTYGETRFQNLKYRCAPALGKLAYAATLLPKRHFITEHFPTQQGIIIDDKPIVGLPGNFKQVLLTRGEELVANSSYSSLDEVMANWDDIVSTLQKS